MQIEIRNRWTGAVQFTVEIDADETASLGDRIGMAVKWAIAHGAYLAGTDLADAHLAGAHLAGADLAGADLAGAHLAGADLAGAPFKIDNIHQRVYEAASQPGALDMSDWHTCETTHCRAGWVVHLAGEAGKVLEWALGSTPAAAAAIYMASDPDLERVPVFNCSEKEALADMKRLAEAEASKMAE